MTAATRAPALLSERAWQQLVVDFAHLHGWWTYHTHNSLRSEPGWPDLVLLRPGEFVVAELKREDGKVTAAQGRVLELLESAGVEVHVWRPSDEPAVFARLARKRGTSARP